MYGNRKIVAIALLTTLITGIHFWLLSSDFYEKKLVKSIAQKSKSQRPTIAALWANSVVGQQTLNNPQSALAENQSSSNELQNQGATRTIRKNPFFFGGNPNSQDPESQFRVAQKLQELALKNEQLIRSSSAKTALKDLKEILFGSEKTQENEKKCCLVATSINEASCNSTALSTRYQNIFNSLLPILNELAREGIKEFCE